MLAGLLLEEKQGGREKHMVPLWLCLEQHYQQLWAPGARSPAGKAHWGSASPW